jgi:23S rRNA pseudouridine2605 synthase
LAQERLQKILAKAGLASRRKAEEMIAAGRVTVDGQVVSELGAKADSARQRICLDGTPLKSQEAKEYWLVHKPRGVVSTVKDPQGRKRVVELLPPEAGRVYPVGRLDRDSEGLVLLTNDGDLANRLMHPRYEVTKTYKVWVQGLPASQSLERLRQGVDIGDERPTSPARVHMKGGSPHRSKLTFVLNEGRKREIRRMCEAVGHPVTRLIRVALGPLKLGELPSGAARRLSLNEIRELRQAAGIIESCKPSGHGVKKSPLRSRSRASPKEAGSGKAAKGRPGGAKAKKARPSRQRGGTKI